MNADRPAHPEIAHVKDLLQKIMAGCRRPDNQEMERIREVWNEFLHEPLTRHASPTALENGALIVHAGSSIIIQQLRFQAKTIIREINRRMGQDRIREIRFKISNT
jgi:predicted nucleic acid-binding Zn ribbon protein